MGRTYGDRCGIARALDLVGERWALLVVREILLGPKRFSDLRNGLPHVSPDVLSQRLRELEQAGILSRRKLAPPAGARVYDLTEWGRELEPVILGLARWGSRAPFPADAPDLGVDALMLALESLFDRGVAEGLEATYELRIGEERFSADIRDGRLTLARGTAPRAAAAIETDTGTLAGLLWHGRRLTDALRAGEIEIEGTRESVRRFLRLFPSPEPAGAGIPS